MTTSFLDVEVNMEKRKRSNDSEREPEVIFVIGDPSLLAVERQANKIRCIATLELNAERVAHFKKRIVELGYKPEQAVIVIVNVDDPNGAPLAEVLMPGYNWQNIRDLGAVPYGRGIAMRTGIQNIIATFDREAAAKLSALDHGTAVVVVDHSVAEVFAV